MVSTDRPSSTYTTSFDLVTTVRTRYTLHFLAGHGFNCVVANKYNPNKITLQRRFVSGPAGQIEDKCHR